MKKLISAMRLWNYLRKIVFKGVDVMKAIEVHFYENIIDVYKTMVIDASSLEDFNRKLESLMIKVNMQAERQGIELCGAKYDLPKEWKNKR